MIIIKEDIRIDPALQARLSANQLTSVITRRLDFKYYLVSNKPVQPYLLLGWIPAAWLTVKDGSASVPEFGAPEIGNAAFTAIFQFNSINLGGGMAIQ